MKKKNAQKVDFRHIATIKPGSFFSFLTKNLFSKLPFFSSHGDDIIIVSLKKKHIIKSNHWKYNKSIKMYIYYVCPTELGTYGVREIEVRNTIPALLGKDDAPPFKT